MQNRFLTASIESTLTLAVGALCVIVIGAGTLGMGRSYDAAPDTAVTVAPLERVVITGTRASAKLAQAAVAPAATDRSSGL